MKRSILLLFVLGSLTLQAQQFRYGFSIAPTRNVLALETDLYDDPAPTFSGFQYGLLFQQTFLKSEMLAITAGFNLNYAESGLVSTNANAQGSDKEWIVRARYIEIPVTLQLRTPELGSFVFYGEGGFAYGKCFRAIGDYLETTNSGSTTGDKDLDYFDRNTSNNGITYLPGNSGIQLGLGAEFKISDGARLVVGAFHQRGLQSVYEDNNDKSEIKLNQTGIRIAGLF